MPGFAGSTTLASSATRAHSAKNSGDPSGKTSASSFLDGGQIGFNYQVAPNWVIGLEGDISGADLKSTALGGPGTVQHDNKIGVFGTARGRLGYAWNNWLLYGSGGFAWADEKLSRTQLAGTVNTATPGTVESATGSGTGWVAGGGLEWGFAQNWTARVEYLHLQLGTESFLFPLAQQRYDARATIDLARFGVNFKFDGPRTGRHAILMHGSCRGRVAGAGRRSGPGGLRW